MTTREDLKQFVRKYGSEFRNIQRVRLGNLAGDIETGTPGLLWARQLNGKEIQVINRALVPSDFDLRVVVGSTYLEPNKWFVLLSMEDYLTPATGGRVAYHHGQHEFPGPDTVWVDRKQITQLTVLVSDASTFTVTVYGGTIISSDGLKIVATQDMILSSFVPVSGAIYASIIADATGVLRVELGTPFLSSTVGDPSYVAIPSSGEYLIAYVLLYDGLTELVDELIAVPMAASMTGSSASSMNWINVQDYGAIGDGSTDDTISINSAIAIFNSTGGGVLYFPRGNYLVSSALTAITAGGMVMGDGMASYDGTIYGSKITCSSATADLFTINSRYFKFENIALANSAGTVTAGSGIKVASSYIAQRVDYAYIYVRGFYIGVDVQVGAEWTMDSAIIIARTKYGIKIRNTVNPDAGDWKVSNTSVYCDDANADAGIRIESSGGGRIIGTKINTGPGATYHFNHGVDIAGAGNTSILFIGDGTSIENITTNPIHAVGDWNYIVISGAELAKYTSGAHNAIYFDGPDYFIIDDVVMVGNSPSTAAAAISLNNCTHGSIGLIQTRYFTSDISQTSCTNITTLPTLSSATPLDIADTADAGTGTTASRDDHVHQGVRSLAESGGTQLFGDVTLSEGANISITPSGNNLSIASTATGGGASQVSAIARWVSSGGATFELPDVAESIMCMYDNGTLVDPMLYSLSSDRTQVVFDSTITAAHVVVGDYIVAQV